MTNGKYKMPEKLMICARGIANSGKSETIIALAVKILSENTNAKVKCHKPEKYEGEYKRDDFLKLLLEEINEMPSFKRDICVSIRTDDNKCIGLNSGGDELSDIELYLTKLIDDKCDIIFCACRSKGETVEVVKRMAKKGGYTLIWTAPYTDNLLSGEKPTSPLQKCLNAKKAEHLSDFI